MKYKIKLGKNEIELLLMGLRYLELNHKGEDGSGNKVNYKPDFRKLLTNINKQI